MSEILLYLRDVKLNTQRVIPYYKQPCIIMIVHYMNILYKYTVTTFLSGAFSSKPVMSKKVLNCTVLNILPQQILLFVFLVLTFQSCL